MTAAAIELGVTMDVACDAYVAHRDIEPDPEQPRANADDELRLSIKARGIQEPLIVRPHPTKTGKWMIVNGERRWRGADGTQREIPINIRYDLENAGDRLLLQLVTNQHRPMRPLDEACAWKRILEEKTWTQGKLARELGVDRTTLGDRIRLAHLSEVWIGLIENGTLGVSHAPTLYKYRDVDQKTQLRVATGVRAIVANLQRSGKKFEIDVFEQFAAHAFSGPAYAESVDAINDVADAHGALRKVEPQGPTAVDASLDDDDGNFESHDAVGRAASIRIAHKLALKIEELGGKSGSESKRKKLKRQLHAMPLWEAFRFKQATDMGLTGFDAFIEYHDKTMDIGVRHSSSPDRPLELLAERYGVPFITHALWRQGPDWFQAGHTSRVSNLRSTIGFLVDVEHGGTMGQAWGRGKEEWLRKLKSQLREERADVIAARVAFGEKPNFAEGAVDRFIARTQEEQTRKVVKVQQRAAEQEAGDESAWTNRRRPAKTYTDAELMDAIERLDLTLAQYSNPRRYWEVSDGRGNFEHEGETVREAVAVAIELAEEADRKGTLAEIVAGSGDDEEDLELPDA